MIASDRVHLDFPFVPVGKHEDGDTGQSMESTNASDDGAPPGSVGLVPQVPALSSEDRGLRPLLKASPPMPVGTITGRYRVRIWRASQRQTFGINFIVTGQAITIGEDLPHLGLRQYDELVSVNGRRAMHSQECRQILSDALAVDMILQHREIDDSAPAPQAAESCTWSLFGGSAATPAAPEGGCGSDPWCFTRGQRPGPAQPLRVLLSATAPAVVPAGMAFGGDQDGGVEFEVTVQRASLKQRFGMNFGFEPLLPSMKGRRAPRMLISEDVYQLGINEGDAVLAVNGVSHERASECQKLLERSMTVTLRLRRLSRDGYPQVAMPADILDAGVGDFEVIEVLSDTNKPCAVCTL